MRLIKARFKISSAQRMQVQFNERPRCEMGRLPTEDAHCEAKYYT